MNRREKWKHLLLQVEKSIKECYKNIAKNINGQNIIAVDKGLEELYELSMIPSHVVGDFDSVSKEIFEYYQNNSQIIFHKYNPEKDNTDTDIAMQLAIQLKSSRITILGALGKRMDHTLANIHILKYALDLNIPCQIVDSYNKIYLIKGNHTFYKNSTYGKYISLIPLTTEVKEITLKGFKYLLDKYSLPIGVSLGISNEIVEEIATIELKSGILIVIESRD